MSSRCTALTTISMHHGRMSRAVTEWVCEYCGTEGRTTEPIVDGVQCPNCGEPVTPLR